eukprot:764706-Hanusia_phi.AAC.6
MKGLRVGGAAMHLRGGMAWDSIFHLKRFPISPEDEGYMPFLKQVLEIDDEEEIKEIMADFPSNLRDYDLPDSVMEEDAGDEEEYHSGCSPEQAMSERVHEYSRNEELANKVVYVELMWVSDNSWHVAPLVFVHEGRFDPGNPKSVRRASRLPCSF